MENTTPVCPFCSGQLEKGVLEVTGTARSHGSLKWESEQKVKCLKRPLLFGKAKEVERKRLIKVLDMKSFMPPKNVSVEETGWYCPNCKKIYAAFDVSLDPESHFVPD